MQTARYPKLGTLTKAMINHIASELSIEHQVPEQENRIRYCIASMNAYLRKHPEENKNSPALDKYWKELEKMGITPDYFLKFLGKAAKSVGKAVKGVGKVAGKAGKAVGKVALKAGKVVGKIALQQAGLDPTMFDKKQPEASSEGAVYSQASAPVVDSVPAPTPTPPPAATPTYSGGGGYSEDSGGEYSEDSGVAAHDGTGAPAQPTPKNDKKIILYIGGGIVALIIIFLLLKKK
jgi:hypothetical protein